MTAQILKLSNDSRSTASSPVNSGQMCLWFTTNPRLELVKCSFKASSQSDEILAVRGKTAGAYATSATFQWTSAVQALVVLLLISAAEAMSDQPGIAPIIEGCRGSLAASLDAAIYKQTTWLDLFGSSARGDSLARRVFVRTNPGLRRAGPVGIALNENLLSRNGITVMVDDQKLSDPEMMLRFAYTIEANWRAQRAGGANEDLMQIATAPDLHNALLEAPDGDRRRVRMPRQARG